MGGMRVAAPEEVEGRRAIALRPRALAVIGLLAGLVGFLFAVLPAIGGPGRLSAGYLAFYSVLAVLSVIVVLVVLGTVITLLTHRASGIALMLGAAVFLVGYLLGYLVSQQLGFYY